MGHEHTSETETKRSDEMELTQEVKTAMFHHGLGPQRKAVTFPEEAIVEPIFDPIHPDRICRVRIPQIVGMRECEYVHVIRDGDRAY
jgi:hypothetical protein